MTRLNKIENGKPILTEAELKRQIEDYLTYQMNSGKLYFDRLNSGEFIEVRGQSRRRIRGCREGTADFFILTKFQCGLWIPRIIFIEVKSERGKLRPEQGAFKKLVGEQLAEYIVVRNLAELEAVLRL